MGQWLDWGGRLTMGFFCGALGLLGAACRESAQSAPDPGARSGAPSWVRTYDPTRADNGYTLTLLRRHEPVLLDMQGRIVHRWPDVRMKSRVRLLPGGSILGIGRGRSVLEVDWNGRELWSYRTEAAFPHHDVVRLANGNTLLVLKVPDDPGDVLEEVSPAGEVVWRWTAMDHLQRLLPAEIEKGDVTHINSVQELPENPWYAAGDDRFRPGNILVSARNLNMALIVDRQTGAVVWSLTRGLDHQHEALMNPPESMRPGWIQIFNNRRRSFGSDRQSEILELDPRTGEVGWRLRIPGFFTSTGGAQQLLRDGGLLITSTRGRRVFEIDRRGDIVWEWTPPFQPVRARRYGADFDPLLRALPRTELRPVQPDSDGPYLDPETYRFSRRGARRDLQLDGVARTVLRRPRACSDVLIPEGARLQLAWGADVANWRKATDPVALDFVAEILASGTLDADLAEADGPPQVLLAERVERADLGDGPLWRTRDVDLAAFGSRRVRLCVGVRAVGPAVENLFGYWQQPVIAGPAGLDDDAESEALDAEEDAVRREHLRAMGYVD